MIFFNQLEEITKLILLRAKAYYYHKYRALDKRPIGRIARSPGMQF